MSHQLERIITYIKHKNDLKFYTSDETTSKAVDYYVYLKEAEEQFATPTMSTEKRIKTARSLAARAKYRRSRG